MDWVSLACNAAWTVTPALLRSLRLASNLKDGPVSMLSFPDDIQFKHFSAAVFSLNEPDVNGISASDAANWYKTYINPLVSTSSLELVRDLKSTLTGHQEGLARRDLEHLVWPRSVLARIHDQCVWRWMLR